MKYSLLIFLVLFGLNLFAWNQILYPENTDNLRIHILDVGQGDSQLIELPGGVQILSDAGPGKEVLFELDKIIPPTDRYIDLLFISHPQVDHFGGFTDVIDSYDIGLIVYSGIEGNSDAWQEFSDKVAQKGIPVVHLSARDKIQYKNSHIDILSPEDEPYGGLNDNSLVFLLDSEGAKALFTGDIGFDVENRLIENDLDIDILKVAHHGSRYSSGLEFLRKVTPRISLIGVGDNNFGHPHGNTLGRLVSVGSEIYRTDINGLISLDIDDGMVKIETEKIE